MTPAPAHWSSEAASSALGCEARGSWIASGVSIDTRTLEVGDLFIALEGPNHDGHDFAAKALEKGAVAAVVSHKPENCPDDARLLIVPDTMAALETLGIASRERVSGRVIAVTGSVGKTGTKEMLRLALSEQGKITATEGNLNNHFGVPLSLSRMKPQTDFGIFEVGMNHSGEIRPLVKMIRPNVAVITAIEAAHIEYFDSIEQIAEAKAEILEGLEPDGVAVLNRDSVHYEQLARAANEAGVAKIYGFGAHEDSYVCLTSLDMKSDTSEIKVVIGDEVVFYEICVPGYHNVMNSLATLAAVSAAGGDVKRAAEALKKFRPLKGRGVRSIVPLPSGGEFVLIDESYNASPASVRATLEVMGRIKPVEDGRRIAVLGDMLELGEATAEQHRKLVEPIVQNNLDLVFTSGQHMHELWAVLPDALRGGRSISPEKLPMVITSILRDGDVVVVKGSLGSRVGVIVDALLELGET